MDSVLDLRRKCKKFAECIRVVIVIRVIANMLFAKSGPLDFPSFVAQESCGLQQLLKNH